MEGDGGSVVPAKAECKRSATLRQRRHVPVVPHYSPVTLNLRRNTAGLSYLGPCTHIPTLSRLAFTSARWRSSQYAWQGAPRHTSA